MYRGIANQRVRFTPSENERATSLQLQPLDGSPPPFASVRLELVAVVRGKEPVEPAFAIMADWEVAPGGDAPGFEASRIALFEQRVDVIPGLFADLLFQHGDEPRRYTVLGLYRDHDDLELARGHSAIQAWAQANPVSAIGASDLHGVGRYRLEAWHPDWMPG